MVARTYWRDGKYWFLNDNVRWEAYQKEDLLTILSGTQLFENRIGDQRTRRGWKAAKFEAFKRRILTKNKVTFVASWPATKRALPPGKGDNYLITKGPKVVKAVEGDFPTIWGLLEDVLGQDQLPYFLGWLKTAYEALRDDEMQHLRAPCPGAPIRLPAQPGGVAQQSGRLAE
jgi:hypothetical protein